jgi:hypothetical protein
VTHPPSRIHSRLLYSLLLLGPASLLESRLSIFAVLLLVIGLASLSRVDARSRRRFGWALGITLALAVIALGRFVLVEALPGIIEAGGRASGGRAVSVLREVSFAQDASRRLALIDPDRNGVGGAGRLGELTGAAPPRGAGRLETPPLAPYLTPRVLTPQGPAAEEQDYLYLVCVPGTHGRLTARPDDQVDERLAERRFVAYAWPRDGSHQSAAFFIDEHERVLESDNRGPGDELRLVGAARAPSCDDALAPTTQNEWRVWRKKAPRRSLPGLPDGS